MLNNPAFIGYNYCREARLYFDACTVKPSSQRRRLLDKLYFRPLKDWYPAKCDLDYLLAAHDEQASRVHLWTPGTRTLTVNGSPTFTTDRGWQANATAGTDYLAPGINFNTAGLKLVQNSAHMGVWSRTDLKDTTPSQRSYDMGGTNFWAAIGRSDNGAGTVYFRPCDATSVDSNVGTVYYPGFPLWVRSASGAYQGYAQGVATAESGSTASTAVVTDAVNILRGNAAAYGVNQLASACMGSQLTAAEVLALFTAKQAVLKAIGAA